MLRLRPIADFNVQLAVCGIAQLRHRIFVVCLESSVVRVFSDCPPYSRLADIVVESMNDPNDMAACDVSNQLYIVDWGYHCVWKLSDVNVTGSSPHASKWITSISPWSVSVGPTSRVLLTPRLVVNGSCSSQGCLYRYDCDYSEDNADSKLVEQIPLAAGINVEHAIETFQNTFIICYTRVPGQVVSTKPEDSDQRASISELTIGGDVLRCFSNPLEWPRHVTVVSLHRGSMDDSADEVIHFRLLVSDFNGGRVAMFDDQLRLIAANITDTEISQPRRLSFERSKRVLLVGQYNGIVRVYGTDFPDFD